jgi:hypothetical protein
LRNQFFFDSRNSTSKYTLLVVFTYHLCPCFGNIGLYLLCGKEVWFLSPSIDQTKNKTHNVRTWLQEKVSNFLAKFVLDKRRVTKDKESCSLWRSLRAFYSGGLLRRALRMNHHTLSHTRAIVRIGRREHILFHPCVFSCYLCCTV